MTEAPLPVHIDTDPGADDLLALALAFSSPELRVVGITTVAGNVDLCAVTENVRRFLALAGLRIPVGRGAPGPIRATPVRAAHIHGPDGRHGVALPPPEDASPRPAKEVLRASIEELGARTVVALGPLTNLAELLEQTPGLLDRCEIVWMGGTLGAGNVSPVAEFNAYADPDAADAVLQARARVRIVGLDVTRRVRLAESDLLADPLPGGPRGRVLHDLLAGLMRAEEKAHGESSAILHDPCTVCALIEPGRFRFEERALGVRTDAGEQRGRLEARTDRPPRVSYATDADTAGLARLCLDRFRRFAGAAA